MSPARGDIVAVERCGYSEVGVVSDVREHAVWVEIDGVVGLVAYDPTDVDVIVEAADVERAPNMLGVVLVGATALLSLVVALSIAAHLAGPVGFCAVALAAASAVYAWYARRAEQGSDAVAANAHLWMAWLVSVAAFAVACLGWGWPR